jgi:endonuclease/exonuclease/phosphatase family metal-dependent hydrolase
MRIRAVLAAIVLVVVVGGGLSAPSAALASGGVHVQALTDGRIRVSWSGGSGPFTVRTSSAQDLSRDVKTYRTTSHSLTVRPTKIATATSGNYTFVNVYSAHGALAGYPFPHARLKPAVPDPKAERVTAATFNVRTAEVDEPGHSWKKRLPVVASQINASGAGVVALEEAGANLGKTVHGPYDYTIDWQFDEVQKAVDPKYRLVYDGEYNEGTGGGKEGTRILYDSSKYVVTDSGFFAPSPVSDQMRWVPWALFTNVATGRQFYFVAVHLDNRRDSAHSRTFYRLRLTQISTIIRFVTKKAVSGNQVILAGDFNSNIYSLPNNGVHDKLVRDGFYDAYATAHNVNEYYETFNFFTRSARGASRTDYIMTYGSLKGSFSYRNVIAKGGTVASDHDLQVATLPY